MLVFASHGNEVASGSTLFWRLLEILIGAVTNKCMAPQLTDVPKSHNVSAELLLDLEIKTLQDAIRIIGPVRPGDSIAIRICNGRASPCTRGRRISRVCCEGALA